MSDKQEVQIQLRASDEVLKGHFANMMQVTQVGPEEFILDFAMVSPPIGILVSRVVVSPGHLKNIVGVLSDQLKRHEAAHGQVEEVEPPARSIGFQAN